MGFVNESVPAVDQQLLNQAAQALGYHNAPTIWTADHDKQAFLVCLFKGNTPDPRPGVYALILEGQTVSFQAWHEYRAGWISSFTVISISLPETLREHSMEVKQLIREGLSVLGRWNPQVTGSHIDFSGDQ